jgi:hypothetical protein
MVMSGGRHLAFGAAVMLLALVACASPREGAPSPSAQPTARAISGLVFAYGVGARNVLDTTRETFVKDMVTASPITIAMQLSASDMARISRKMDEIGFFSYPAVFTVPVTGGGGEITPFVTYRFAVTTDAGTKVVEWADKIPSDDERARGLRSLARLIERIIVAKPDYRKLPEPPGGYL